MRKFIIAIFFSLFCFANEELLLNSANAYIMTQRTNQNTPFNSLMKQSKAIIIFHSVKKVGFVLGGMGGDGVMILNPSSNDIDILSVSISGGSLGLQIGYEDSTLVLFIMKNNVISDIKDGKIAINADATFAFGDVSGGYKSIKDFKFSKDIYAYATNSGFFAGASFGGVVINLKNRNFKMSGYAYEQLIHSIDRN